MRCKKILAFSICFTVAIILANGRGVIMSRHNAVAAVPQRTPATVGYALAVPADVPGLSAKSDREQEHLFGPVKTVKREQLDTTKVLGLFTRTQSRLISSISFNPEGNKTEEINYSTGGASINRVNYRYDGKGRKIAQVVV